MSPIHGHSEENDRPTPPGWIEPSSQIVGRTGYNLVLDIAVDRCVRHEEWRVYKYIDVYEVLLTI